MDLNVVVLGGRLTRDPELRVVDPKNGGDPRPVANFGLAVNRGYNKDVADFFECSVWGKQAESLTNHRGKGDSVVIRGEARFRTWEAKDGSKRSAVSFECYDIRFVWDRKEDGQQGSGNNIAQASGGSSASVNRGGVELNEKDYEDIPEEAFDNIPF